ncbi:MAG: aldo/keto reductase [Anaerolineae bacterium]|nr:aldo/keto reductase [Anaerolineae bacterium]
MQYRNFGRMGWKVSALGFGCMRLPTTGEYANIDEPEAIRMLHYAIDHGVNYVDTAYGYHGGNSERLLAKALRGGYREKVKLATKLPPPLVETAADFDRLLNEQLSKLQTEHIDVYLLHGLRASRWEQLRQLDVLGWADGAMADGRIGCLGFSFHDSTEVLRQIVDAYDNWAMCQVQYNFMDVNRQAGTEGVRYAASKGLAVVVMEPLLGGRLVNPPKAVREVWDAAGADRTPVEWALQWLWDQPEISVVLSGMSTMQQVRENVESASRSGVRHLTDEEREVVARAREAYQGLTQVPCTGCEYCMPCPQGVNIPRNFRIYNEGYMYNQADEARRNYARMAEEERASLCAQCRQCEDLCPQNIEISQWLPKVEAVLGQGEPYS